MQEKISVIVPVYNVNRYLDVAVGSILAQHYDKLEILLIDDGSTDGSGNRCDIYAEKDARIRVIHQENRGLSAARNTGLNASTSEYLAFLDSDDAMMPTMMEKLWTVMETTDADIVQCEFEEVYDDEAGGADVLQLSLNERSRREDQGDKMGEAEGVHIYTKEMEKQDQIWSNYKYTPVQWNKLYKRKIFEDLRYPEGKFHEDEYVIHRELAQANALVHLESKLQLYRKHKHSITGKPSAEKACHVTEAYLDRIRFFFEEEEGMCDFGMKCYRGLLQYKRDHVERLCAEGKEGWIQRIDENMSEAEALVMKYRDKMSLKEKIKNTITKKRI